MTTLVSDAVAVMDRAGKVIDGLSEVVARLRRDNAAMLEALEEIVAEADQSNGGKGARLPIVLHIKGLAEAAIRLAKGESHV